MKTAVILSVLMVASVLWLLVMGSFITWRNALREFGVGYWLRLTVALVVLMWVICGIAWLGDLL
ncbi:hypothetical protein JS958_001337 [Salmonella enterica subsp. enterica serovar Infantis]|nr:hypothetical protein [Salmonella enterica subsp. enterica serovar Javiana]EHC4523576.1 hypothetical protein [Salmonella enterica subsp. enterica serovar Infantis]EHC5870327.1 hypothetical protein [Salmonella enterica subsp. enterica serovar Eastbourne]EMB5319114.1 hypothetical protein [Salmonella enterica]EHC5910368.1 hypothetical protein [Salmonella enterica subsp. enterica serovar Eastbourne]